MIVAWCIILSGIIGLDPAIEITSIHVLTKIRPYLRTPLALLPRPLSRTHWFKGSHHCFRILLEVACQASGVDVAKCPSSPREQLVFHLVQPYPPSRIFHQYCAICHRHNRCRLVQKWRFLREGAEQTKASRASFGLFFSFERIA
jgi:hypothetical protein